jgi:hypothetical protein
LLGIFPPPAVHTITFFMASRSELAPPLGDIDLLWGACGVWVCGGWDGLEGKTLGTRWTSNGWVLSCVPELLEMRNRGRVGRQHIRDASWY